MKSFSNRHQERKCTLAQAGSHSGHVLRKHSDPKSQCERPLQVHHWYPRPIYPISNNFPFCVARSGSHVQKGQVHSGFFSATTSNFPRRSLITCFHSSSTFPSGLRPNMRMVMLYKRSSALRTSRSSPVIASSCAGNNSPSRRTKSPRT